MNLFIITVWLLLGLRQIICYKQKIFEYKSNSGSLSRDAVLEV